VDSTFLTLTTADILLKTEIHLHPDNILQLLTLYLFFVIKFWLVALEEEAAVCLISEPFRQWKSSKKD